MQKNVTYHCCGGRKNWLEKTQFLKIWKSDFSGLCAKTVDNSRTLFMYRDGVTDISPDRNGQTEMSRDRNGPDRNGPDQNGWDRIDPDRNDSNPNGSDRNGQTESAKPTRPNRNVVFSSTKMVHFCHVHAITFCEFFTTFGHSDIFYEEWIFQTCFHIYLHVFEHNHCFFWVRHSFAYPQSDVKNEARNASSAQHLKMRREKISYNILKCRRIFSGSWIIANILPQSQYIGS